MPPAANYEPTALQRLMLDSLMHAPRYLIIRKRPWTPAIAILPVFSDASAEHGQWACRQRNETCQLVNYRPDEEDLAPAEPNPWPVRLLTAALCLAVLIAALVAFRI